MLPAAGQIWGLSFIAFAMAQLCLITPTSAEEFSKGKSAFKKCRACHQVGPEAKNKVGPALNGILGRAAASYPDFKYSKALKKAAEDGLVWSEENLDHFLQKPNKFVKGTKMSFAGLKKPEQRAVLISWLSTFAEDGTTKTKAASNDGKQQVVLLGASAAQLEGDAEYGQYLSGECVTCHKLDGAAKGIPAIVGWPKAEFIHAMYEYKTKVRQNPVMQTVAGRLGDEELAGLAAYFGAVPSQ